MSKYENFNHLVAKNLDTAQISLQMDICYLIGMMRASGVTKISMLCADSAYCFENSDKRIDFFICEQDGQYVLTVQSEETNRILASVSVMYELYQIADILSDAYLMFYMNTHVKEINDEM